MQERGGRTAPRVAYVLAQFPPDPETDLAAEMVGLGRWHGLGVVPLGLRPAPAALPLSPEAEALAGRAVVPGPRRWRLVAALLLAGLRWPVGGACALGLALRQGLPRPARLGEALHALGYAAYFALQAPRGLRHVHAVGAGFPATVALLLAELRNLAFSFAAPAADLFSDRSRFLSAKLGEAEFVTVASAYARDNLLRLHPLGSRGKLHLVHPGVDTDLYRPAPPPSRRVPVVLFVGPLVERKGLPVLLRAAGILRSRGAEFRLVLLGDGPERADLLSLATGLGLRDRLELRPAAGPEAVRAAFAEAEVFALPSVVTAEGDRDELPAPLLQALSSGVPTVAGAVTALPEVVEPERTGLLTKPGDAPDLADQLERLLYDEDLRAVVSRQARERMVDRFSLQRTVAHLAELMEAAR